MKIKKASEMIMSTELVNMKRVMRRLDMIDKNLINDPYFGSN